ncbi:hypothetical protein [Pseudoalteromonas piscicida]|uniref:Uncharacterized protein n=1 Tax=Pseudoalteromonas piscicida TaxID=43662 RepID=A0A2A5JVR5_PSEO7|nr:hypothetical protein [Pseudoalteromonas piscicida]PCK33535.1 hypothetical protein CEX98_01385 [Pseudoalteromonas piscicida]
MRLVSKAIVNSLSDEIGVMVLELEDCTRWSMVDRPPNTVQGETAHVYGDGRKYYVQFGKRAKKYVVDEM